jgi:hypothetical protein
MGPLVAEAARVARPPNGDGSPGTSPEDYGRGMDQLDPR